MGINKKLVACAVILSLVVTQKISVKADTIDTVIELSDEVIGGANRVDTALEISDRVYENFGESNTAIIANGEDTHVVDALAVIPLAYQKKAAILLTTGKSINVSVLNKLKAKAVKNVYLIGFAATDKNKEVLKKDGYSVTTLSGKNRFDTALNINEALGKSSKIAIVNGYSEIDSLSIGYMAAKHGMQIILSKTDELPANMPSISDETQVYVIGGTGAISDRVMNELKAKRLGGNTRYETNEAVIQEFQAECVSGIVYVANGETKGVDALAGAVLAAQSSSPIVIIGKYYTEKYRDYFKDAKEAIRIGNNVNRSVYSRLINRGEIEYVENILLTLKLYDGTRTGNYTGPVIADIPEGNGRFVTRDNSNIQYTVNTLWINGHMNGAGTVQWVDGGYYEGDIKDDVIEGKGNLTYTDGSIYIGDFEKGQVSGKGTFINMDGSTYVGDFKNDLFNGKGKLTFYNEDNYVGVFKDGIQNGIGVYTFLEGSIYTGNWLGNMINGKGTYTDMKKVIHSVEFKNSKIIHMYN